MDADHPGNGVLIARRSTRFWRTIKYEEVYIHAYTNVPEARAAIGRYILFFNSRRPHTSLDGQTPDLAYFNQLPTLTVAA